MINKLILHGRLVRDPELRENMSGVKYVTFTVVSSHKYGEVEKTLFQDCIAWRGAAEIIGKMFTKGQEICVSGELKTDTWKDKDGNSRSKNVCEVSEFDFCGKKEAAATGSDQKANEFVDVPDGVEEELPFN